MSDMRSGKEFWDEARNELGYKMVPTEEEIGFRWDGENYVSNAGVRLAALAKDEAREDIERYLDGYGGVPMEMHFDVSLENLSHQIARETGQAKEIAPGIVKYKSREPERFLTPEEREIERQEFGPNGYRGENTTTRNGAIMQSIDNAFLQQGYAAQQQLIDRLEAWVAEAISKPSIPRELRLEGLGLVEDRSPTARQAVERICPRLGLEQGLELAIER